MPRQAGSCLSSQTLGASLAVMKKQLGFFSLSPQRRLAAVMLWHVMPPLVRRAAASAERLTAARALRCCGAASACAGRSAWLSAVALLARQLARVQVASPHSGAVPSSLGLRLTRQSTGLPPAAGYRQR